MLFHLIDDCFVVLRDRGVFRQSKVYRRGRYIYAGVGSGFLRLMNRGATTRPTTSWEDLTASAEIRIASDGHPWAANLAPSVELARPDPALAPPRHAA